MPDSLQPHGLQHVRPPCPSPTPRACSNSCPLSWWCHPTISSSVFPFSSCPQSFPASGSFPMSQLFTSGGQSIGASASAAYDCVSCVYLMWNYKAGMEGISFVPCPCFWPVHFLILLTSCLMNFRLAYPTFSITWANFTKSPLLPSFFSFLPLSLFSPLLSLSLCLSFSLYLFSLLIYLISLEFKH